MEIFTKIAERRIQEALENGEFDDLANAGKPLHLLDDGLVPSELRMAYKVLKNAGCVPPELALRNEIISIRSLISTIDDDEEMIRKLRELNFKLLTFNEMRGSSLNLEDIPEYESTIYEKYIS